MGMYTEIVVGCQLKIDTPKEVIEVLKYMIDHTEEKPYLPKHKFFKCSRWHMVASCGSYYFGVHDSHSLILYDDISKAYNLSIRANLKNYDNEITLFIDWLRPYIDRGSGRREFFGYSIYEEADEPELYFLIPPTPKKGG